MNEVTRYLLEPSILEKPSGNFEHLQSLIDSCAYRDFLREDKVQSILKELLTEEGVNNVSDDITISCIGIAALQTFLNINWLGESVLQPESCDQVSPLVSSVLVRDGDSLNTSVTNPDLLVVAKMTLVDRLTEACQDLSLLTWGLRCCCVLAQVLEEKSDLLHQQMTDIAGWGLQLVEAEEDGRVSALFLLQCARYHSIFYKVKDAERMTDLAASRLGLSLSETGALGKRTKYQVKDVAQFCIEVATENSEDLREIEASQLVRDVKLEDDLRLKKIQYQDSARGERERSVRLTGLQQCVLMSRYTCKVDSLARVSAGLTAEEVLPYLAPTLDCPQAWPTHLTALIARSKIESEASRTVERSLAQLESCVEDIKVNTSQEDRLRLVHVSNLPPLWEVERQLGKLLLSLGLTKAALEVFTRLEQWEEVIVCYTLLELRHRAAEVIRARLEERETARLWCLLGDATDDLDCYHKALNLSNNRSARAYRSLGLHHYFNKEYSQCLPFFQQSLDLSSFQPLLLLRQGFSAMELENWDLAAQSYRKYCALEMDNFEAWNNLANCYVKLGQKERAWRVLQESVRCDFENWKVWDNLMVISVDIGAFSDVIRSYNRILDIKQTHSDDQVLGILVKAVLEDILDIEGAGASRYREKVQKLLARLTVAMPKEAAAWRLYGDLLLEAPGGQTETVRGVQSYQKSLAALTSVKGWERGEEKCAEVVSLSLRLMEAVGRVEGVQQLQLASSIRLSVSSASKLIQQGQTNVSTGEMAGDIQAQLQPLMSSLAALTDRIAKLREG